MLHSGRKGVTLGVSSPLLYSDPGLEQTSRSQSDHSTLELGEDLQVLQGPNLTTCDRLSQSHDKSRRRNAGRRYGCRTEREKAKRGRNKAKTPKGTYPIRKTYGTNSKGKGPLREDGDKAKLERSILDPPSHRGNAKV